MEQLSESCSQEWNIANIGISIIVRSTLTSPPVSASGACTGLSPLATPSGFSRPLAPSPSTSVHVGIGLLRLLLPRIPERIPALVGDHDSSPDRLKERRDETASPSPWNCIPADKLTIPPEPFSEGHSVSSQILYAN